MSERGLVRQQSRAARLRVRGPRGVSFWLPNEIRSSWSARANRSAAVAGAIFAGGASSWDDDGVESESEVWRRRCL
jgi:hypothetical protein